MTYAELNKKLLQFKVNLEYLKNELLSNNVDELNKAPLIGILILFEGICDAHKELILTYLQYAHPDIQKNHPDIFSTAEKAIVLYDSVKLRKMAEKKFVQNDQQDLDKLRELCRQIISDDLRLLSTYYRIISFYIEVPYLLTEAILAKKNADIPDILKRYESDCQDCEITTRSPFYNRRWQDFLLHPFELALKEQNVEALAIFVSFGLTLSSLIDAILKHQQPYSESFIGDLFNAISSPPEVNFARNSEFLFDCMKKEKPSFALMRGILKFGFYYTKKDDDGLSALELAVVKDTQVHAAAMTELLCEHLSINMSREFQFGETGLVSELLRLDRETKQRRGKGEDSVLYLCIKAASRAIQLKNFQAAAILFSTLNFIQHPTLECLEKFAGNVHSPESIQYGLFNQLASRSLDENGEITYDYLAPLLEIRAQSSQPYATRIYTDRKERDDRYFSAASVLFYQAIRSQLIPLQAYLLKKYCLLLSESGRKLFEIQKRVYLEPGAATVKMALFTEIFSAHPSLDFLHFYARLNAVSRENDALTSMEMAALACCVGKYLASREFPENFCEKGYERDIFNERIMANIFVIVLSRAQVRVTDESCYKKVMFSILPSSLSDPRPWFWQSQLRPYSNKEKILADINQHLGNNARQTSDKEESWVTALQALKYAVLSAADPLTGDVLTQIIAYWKNAQNCYGCTNQQIINPFLV